MIYLHWKKYGNSEENNSRSNNIEKSDKNKKSNGLNGEEDILNEINKFQYKKTFAYKSFFKKDSEKILKSIIKKNQYFISVLDSEEFKIIIYGNDEKDFNEEKGVLEKEYKPFEKKYEYIRITNDYQDVVDAIKDRSIDMLCINDAGDLDDEYYQEACEALTEAFEERFPNESKFEIFYYR